MNMKKVISTAVGILAATALNVHGQVIDPLATVKSNNVGATQAYGPTAIQPQIRLNLENDTDKIHFVRNNTDPYVVTKVYEVKNTDVYELRPLIISAIRTKKITQDNTYVEAIRYNNGASYLIISAEADRFGKQNNGMGIDEIIAALDQPKLKYTVYEIYAENDGKIGLDFQSWKNNDGTDLFALGGRYRSNWANTWAGGIDQNGANKTQFFNFNPKWNSKYLDFLVSKGKAKVRNSGNVLVKNNEVATINATTRVFYDQYVDGTDKPLSDYATVGDQINPLPGGGYTFSATSDNKNITINGGTFSLTKVGFTLIWNPNIIIAKGPTINTLPSGAFGFVMTVSPQICQDSTKLTVSINNSSLIGWTSNGDPRIANNDTINTDIFIGNKGNRFVIGGINKENVVRSVTGIPYLRELPGLGWIFSSESESSKKSQLVVTAEVNTKSIFAQLTEGITDSIRKIEKGTEGAGEKVQWGFDQYIIDKKL